MASRIYLLIIDEMVSSELLSCSPELIRLFIKNLLHASALHTLSTWPHFPDRRGGSLNFL